MPVETFAAFVAEQAVGIAVGAIAVIAAPTVGPKMGSVGHDMIDGMKSTMQSVQEKTGQLTTATTESGKAAISKARDITIDGAGGTAALIAAPVAATGAAMTPVTDSGRSVFSAIAGGAEWYGDKWSDLVHEARAGLATGDSTSTADVLAGLSDARVVASTDGRARLRLPEIKGDKGLAAAVSEALGAKNGIDEVKARSSSGGLLITYDPQVYDSLDALLQSVGG